MLSAAIIGEEKFLAEKETLLRLYDRLKETTLRPSDSVNSLFDQLVSLITAERSEELAEKLLRDSDIRRILPSLQLISAKGEDLLERLWSQFISSSNCPLEKLIKFPYYENYQKLVRMELHAAWSINKQHPQRALMIGGGALPLTAILLAREHNISVDVIDRDKEACEQAAGLIEALELPSVRIHVGDVRTYTSLGGYDLVIVAVLVGKTPREKSEVIQHIKHILDAGTILVLRTSHGLRQLLYCPVPPSALSGLIQHMIVHPRDGVINSIIVAESIGAHHGASERLQTGA